MPFSDPYAFASDYRAVAQDSDTASDLIITRHLMTISRLFDAETGQWFGRDDEATDRIYIGKYFDYLDLTVDGCPGLATATDLVISVDRNNDGTYSEVWSTGDYELWPRNATPEPTPFTRIVVPSWSSRSFPIGSEYGRARGHVKVTGIFGWPAVPAAVRDDVIELCRIWRTASPRATGRVDELNQIISSSPMAMSLVTRLRDAYQGALTF